MAGIAARTLLAGGLATCSFAGPAPRGTGSDGGGASRADGGGGGGSGASDSGSPGRVIGSAPLGDAACATQTQIADRLPLDMYILMDSSASMLDLTTAGMSKWDATKAALTSFFGDPQSSGMGVGLQYFPLTRPGVVPECAADSECGTSGPCKLLKSCDNGGTSVVFCEADKDCGAGGHCLLLGGCSASNLYCLPSLSPYCSNRRDTCLPIPGYCTGRDLCDATAYATPAVEVAALPGARAALVASLGQHMPDGLTPTAGALSGAVTHAQALARATPGHRVVAVLATDGLPSECTPTDIDMVAAIAAAGHAGTPPISTFVVGVFGPTEAAQAQANLDALAAAGGTGKAFVINTDQNVTQSFTAALNSIRNAAVACQYKIPASKDGSALDYYSVNVEFTSGAGQTVTIGNVHDKASCHPTQGGWYYDVDPKTATPQTISICDNTCTQLRADAAGRVDVLLGCKTEVVVP